jgi:hypothetical protein
VPWKSFPPFINWLSGQLDDFQKYDPIAVVESRYSKTDSIPGQNDTHFRCRVIYDFSQRWPLDFLCAVAMWQTRIRIVFGAGERLRKSEICATVEFETTLMVAAKSVEARAQTSH